MSLKNATPNFDVDGDLYLFLTKVIFCLHFFCGDTSGNDYHCILLLVSITIPYFRKGSGLAFALFSFFCLTCFS